MSGRHAEDHRLELDGLPVHYRRLPAGPAAAGPPLLLLHGISCCTRTWEPFLEALACCPGAPAAIVPDLPAHGGSGRPRAVLGMAAFAEWTGRFLDRIEAPRV